MMRDSALQAAVYPSSLPAAFWVGSGRRLVGKEGEDPDRVSFLLPRLYCNSAILSNHKLQLLGSSESRASASQIAGITGMHHHAQLIFLALSRLESPAHCTPFPVSSNSPASASRVAGTTAAPPCPAIFTLVETGFHLLARSLALPRDPPASASQSAGITADPA
ncbi:hypothetical protein AAY473_030924 [Plecturocebus cupreus]